MSLNLPAVTRVFFDALEGRTIKRAFRAFDGDTRISLLLDNGTVFSVEAESGYYNGDVSLNDADQTTDYQWGAVLVGLDLMTEDALNAEAERDRAESAARAEQNERERYEALKLKYEGSKS